MSEFISSVGAGKDYTTLTAWEAGEQTSVSAGDQVVAEIYGTVADPDGTLIDSWTFGDSTSRIVIRAASGESHGGVFTGGGATLSCQNATAISITLSTTDGLNLDIIGIRFIQSSSSYAHLVVEDSGANATDLVVDDCVFDVPGSSGRACQITVAKPATLATFNNCVSRDGAIATYYALPAQKSAMVLNYCTHYEGDRGAYPTVANNCFFVNTSVEDFLDMDSASDYNISSDASAPGGNVLIKKTSYNIYFTDTTT